MDFELPEELKMVQTLVRNFVNEQLKPLERDLLGRSADLSEARMYLPAETEAGLIEVARRAGLWGVSIPEKLGGIGLGTLGNCLVEEELTRTVVPFDFGDVTPILFDCNEQQMDSYFRPAFNRQKRPYLALMEPDNGEQPLNMGTRAEKENGYYHLSGKKLSFSRAGDDYFAIVFAVTVNDTGEGVTCFLVDKDTPGLQVTGGDDKPRQYYQTTEPLILRLDQCRVPQENILGEEGKAFSLGKKWLPSRRVIRGARCIGVARRLLEEATTRAQTWQSFGENISGRTDVQAALADIAASIHACRLTVHEAAWKADTGKPIVREAAMVKLFATQMIYNVTDRVAHIYGGPPSVAGITMEKLRRHALASSTGELSLEIQRRIIAGDILKGLTV